MSVQSKCNVYIVYRDTEDKSVSVNYVTHKPRVQYKSEVRTHLLIDLNEKCANIRNILD